MPAPRYEDVTLVHEEYKLNSGTRPGGMSRAFIPLHVPRHTLYLIYSVAASPRNPLQDLGLHAQVRDKIHAQGASLSIGSQLLNKLFSPPADGVTDVLLFNDSTNAALYSVHIDEPCIEDYSRHHVANAIVGIPIKYTTTDTTLYLCLRNPEAVMAEYVTIEVVAVRKLGK